MAIKSYGSLLSEMSVSNIPLNMDLYQITEEDEPDNAGKWNLTADAAQPLGCIYEYTYWGFMADTKEELHPILAKIRSIYLEMVNRIDTAINKDIDCRCL